MAKVLEGPGMGLMKKWGIHVPNYAVVTSADELAKLGQANEWMKDASPGHARASLEMRLRFQTIVVMLNSRTETVLPKHGPTDGADSTPE